MAVESGPRQIARVFTTRRETRAFYDKISRYYDLLAEHSEAPMRAAGLEMLAPQPGDRVLEIGCGTGHCVVDLAAAVGASGRVVALDLSEKMLARSRQLVVKRKSKKRVRLICADGLQLPLRSSSADSAFLSFTLELFDTGEIPMVLREIRRVLKAGGRIAVVGMSKEGPGGVAVELYEWSHRHFPNFVDCRPIFVARSLEAAGFHLLRVETQHMWLPVEIVLAVSPGATS